MDILGRFTPAEQKQNHEDFLRNKEQREENATYAWTYANLSSLRRMEFDRLVRNEGYDLRKAFEAVGVLFVGKNSPICV